MLALLLLIASPEPPAPEHLEPEDSVFGGADWYDVILRRTLLPGRHHFVQMLVAPSFDPEYSISIERSAETSQLVYRRARKQVWAELTREDENGRVDLAPLHLDAALPMAKAELEVVRAPIDEETVRVLEGLWEKALLGTRYPPDEASCDLVERRAM